MVSVDADKWGHLKPKLHLMNLFIDTTVEIKNTVLLNILKLSTFFF